MENMIDSQQRPELIANRSSEEIADKVILAVSTEMGIPASELALTRTFEDLGIDSLNGLSIMTELENTFGVHIENEAIARISSLADVVNAIQNALFEKAGGGRPNV
jgi:acyl carrier protein